MLSSTSNVGESCLRVEARQIREAYMPAYSCMEKGFALHLKDFYARNVIRDTKTPLRWNTRTRGIASEGTVQWRLATPSPAWDGIVKYVRPLLLV